MAVVTNSNPSSNESKPKAKVWLNVGKVQKSGEGKEYLLSPYFGTALDTAETKRFSKQERELHAALLKFAKEKGVGTHEINLTVQMTVLGDEPKEVEQVDFDL